MTTAASIAELLELTARKLHSRGHACGMFPAQWAALRYFSRAPEALRTASELARFQGLANGPVSRTVRTLVQKGLLAKAAEQPKGRAELLALTETGRTLLEGDPTLELKAALTDLPETDRRSLARTLELLAARLG
ncbi:MarR family winged helix-turn-helix transcriptional regulator [Devosia psychrophila]|uniref:DNA-binding transcriptional regulator, MarR family n=1 Tax=Devosia psychrophila TaxID=728005 RepID=A0A1I1P6V0_9HYPH|nr:MarR family transcriptional regulator [Devosia psychrophila]SFD05557.1 DNA-binding transcriptional regulator, MarR family [Devosia psychrophila]